MRYHRKEPGDSSYIDEAWDLKERIRRDEGYLCQTWDFFSRAYTKNTTHLYLNEEVNAFTTVRSDGYVLFLAVAPEHRQEGLGRTLIRHIEEDHDHVACHARESNQNAIDFYRHMGFEVDRHIESYYQNGDSAYYLTKNNPSDTSFTSKLTDVIGGDN